MDFVAGIFLNWEGPKDRVCSSSQEIDDWLKGKHIEVTTYRNQIDLDANNPEKIVESV